MMKKKIDTIQFRCEKCNTPYPLAADDVIATCPYCGYTYEIDGNEIEHFIVPNKLDKSSILSFFKEWIESVSPKTVGHSIIKDINNITPMLVFSYLFYREARSLGTGTEIEK